MQPLDYLTSKCNEAISGVLADGFGVKLIRTMLIQDGLAWGSQVKVGH